MYSKKTENYYGTIDESDVRHLAKRKMHDYRHFIGTVYTMNRNGKSELVYVWGEILLRNMVFAHH
jgi:hypothetical protein